MSETTAGSVESPSDYSGKDGKAQRWAREIKLALKDSQKWRGRAEKVLKRYRDERSSDETWADADRRFNILWSNVQTLGPAIYAQPPSPVVERRFDDQDDVGRVASEILQRGLTTQLAEDDFHDAVLKARDDYLLPGRGTAWCRYHPVIEPRRDPLSPDEEPQDQLVHENVFVDYVNWQDFLHSPARTWQEVDWVARRVTMTRDAGKKRFGRMFSDVPLDYKPGKDDSGEPDDLPFAQAVVWEIWCRDDRKVRWLAPSYLERLLDEIDDPLGLSDFWPCPPPLYATLTTSSLMPIPDYVMYRDQAEQMDELTQRMDNVLRAIAVKGAYNGGFPDLARVVRGGENELVAVENWAAFAQGGGFKGNFELLPIDMLSKVLAELTEARTVLKNDIYEITGISDIIRGQSAASETATAQNIKSHFATLRLSDRQAAVARFCRSTVRIVAEIMARHFAPATLLKFADYEQEGDQDHALALQGIALLKNEIDRGFRLDIETDSTIAEDQDQQQQSRLAFLEQAGQFIQTMMPLVQQTPAMGPVAAQMLLFGIRSFRVGRELESSFEKAVIALQKEASMPPKPPADSNVPPPQLLAADVQHRQAQAQAVAQKAQADVSASAQDSADKTELTRVQIQNYQSQVAERSAMLRMKAEAHAQTLAHAANDEARRNQAHNLDLQLRSEAALARSAAVKSDEA